MNSGSIVLHVADIFEQENVTTSIYFSIAWGSTYVHIPIISVEWVMYNVIVKMEINSIFFMDSVVL